MTYHWCDCFCRNEPLGTLKVQTHTHTHFPMHCRCWAHMHCWKNTFFLQVIFNLILMSLQYNLQQHPKVRIQNKQIPVKQHFFISGSHDRNLCGTKCVRGLTYFSETAEACWCRWRVLLIYSRKQKTSYLRPAHQGQVSHSFECFSFHKKNYVSYQIHLHSQQVHFTVFHTQAILHLNPQSVFVY